MQSTASIPVARVVPLLRLLLLPIALLAALLAGTLVGAVDISPAETVRILLFKLGLYAGHITWSSGDQAIVWSLRLPRVIAAALVGAALGVAGALFQAVLRNPLADPYVIGTAAGAQVGVVAGVLLPLQFLVLGFGPMQVLAFVGALGTVVFVYSLARVGGRTPIVTLLLAGFVVSSFLISSTTALAYLSGRINQVLTWTMGGLDVSAWGQLATAAPVILGSITLAYLASSQLDVLLLGEEQAQHLGVRVERLKLAAIVLASLLTALAVTLAGVVAFVGLIVPHAARLIYGPHHRILIPASAALGAVFLILADLVAHLVLSPTILPLGVVTAIIGAPFFLHLLRRSRRDYGI
ncbi:MAG: iron ABC transporter permease [Chloroflexota bacterium]|nr:iron ABC transporter permease [Chloroflexota bacterium]